VETRVWYNSVPLSSELDWALTRLLSLVQLFIKINQLKFFPIFRALKHPSNEFQNLHSIESVKFLVSLGGM